MFDGCVRLIRQFFCYVMATGKRIPCHIGCIIAPYLQWVLSFSDKTRLTPECQHGAIDLLVEVSLVVDQIYARSGTVVLAYSMDCAGDTEASYVVGYCLRGEDLFGGLGAFENTSRVTLGIPSNDFLWKIKGLNQEEPVPSVGGEIFVDYLEH